MAKILIIDDDANLCALLKAWFETEKHTVSVGLSGSDFKALTSPSAQRGYDLIILDVILPDTDGFNLCSQSKIASPNTPIIIMTGKSEVRHSGAIESGADGFIRKPLFEEDILSCAKALLRMKRYRDELQAKTMELKESKKKLHNLHKEITHEVKSPITAILGYAELLDLKAGTVIDEKHEDFLRRLVDSSRSASTIISKLDKELE